MDDNVIGIIVQILTVGAAGFGLWHSIRNMTAAVEAKLDKLDEKVTGQIAALDEKVTRQIAALDERVTRQIAALDERVTGQIAALDKKVTGQIGTLDEKFDAKIDKLGSDLRTEIATVRNEIATVRNEIATVRNEIGAVRNEVSSVRTELIARIDRVHEDLVDARVHLSDRISRLEGAVLGHLAPPPRQIPLTPDRTR